MNKHERTRRVLNKFIPAVLVLVSTVIALMLGEVLVRFFVNPSDFLYATLEDDQALGHRIKPHTTGHDALGFRNLEVPEHADIVAIGDSMTYGVSAVREGSWPYQLGSLMHEPVYNMALGGYGPLQYLHLVQNQAKKLKPRLLVIGFYFGNDLMDSYNLAHQRPFWHGWRESDDNIATETKRDRAIKAEPKKRFEALRNWLSRNSVLYSMMRATIFPRLALMERDSMALQSSPERQMLWTDPAQPAIRTIFTPQLRFSALDMSAQSVREGLSITKRALASIKDEADAQGIRLIFVLIPTKERVYYPYLKATGAQIPVTFLKVYDNEELIKKDMTRFLIDKRIEYVDVTNGLEEKAQNHAQIYPIDSDGHPIAAGYGVIASKLYAVMQSQH